MATDVRSPIDLAEERDLHREASTISLWRGYVTAAFYAHSFNGAVIAESQAFRWRKASAPPNAGAARAAHDALAAALEARGWATVEGDGNAWYEVAFERWVARTGQVAPRGVEPVHEPAVPAQPPPVAIVRPAKASRPPDKALSAPPAPRPKVESRPRRHRRRAAIVAGLAVLTLSVVSGSILALQSGHGTASDQRRHSSAIAPPPPASTPAPTGSPAAVPKVVRLRVSAVGTGSWLEVRRGSSKGALLYQDTLTAGKSVHFKGARLWAQFGAAGNLAIVADGRRVPFNGTIEHTFIAKSR